MFQNLLPGNASGTSTVSLEGGLAVKVAPETLAARSGRVAVGIRPEKIGSVAAR